jgi:septum formation protein
MTKKKIILASASKGRAFILQKYGIDFIIDPANIDENYLAESNIEVLLLDLARTKANVVKQRHKAGIILAADTIVFLDEKIIGKPKNIDDAYKMLSILSGKTHQVMTAIVLLDIDTNQTFDGIKKTAVTFKNLSSSAIDTYVATGEPFGKAGAYSSQENGKDLIEKIDGDPTNVIGLPIELFFKLLNKFD